MNLSEDVCCSVRSSYLTMMCMITVCYVLENITPCQPLSVQRAEDAGSLVVMDIECTASECSSCDDRSYNELLEVVTCAVDSLQLENSERL